MAAITYPSMDDIEALDSLYKYGISQLESVHQSQCEALSRIKECEGITEFDALIQETEKILRSLQNDIESFCEAIKIIDKIAENENRSRSELIREALRTYMNKQNIVNKYISNPIVQQNADILEEML